MATMLAAAIIFFSIAFRKIDRIKKYHSPVVEGSLTAISVEKHSSLAVAPRFTD